jgi:4-methylaminobutanoate oxidase (formaldehyde-forming)
MVDSDQTVNENYLATGNWEVEVAGRLFPAVVSLRPLYDPGSARIKA